MIALAIVLIIIVVLVFLSIGIYNSYVLLDEKNLTAFSDLGSYLQKRLDLIPNLVETVKGYATHESQTLQKVIEARSQLLKIDMNNIENLEKINKLENQLTNTLRSILSLNESYPGLKADSGFLNLSRTLEKLEEEIVGARRYYNATAMNLNVFTRKFPNVIFSGIFRFRKAELFKEDEEAKKAPKVSF